MTTLTPIGGRGRRRSAAIPVIVVGVVALLVGALAGWYLTREPDPAGTATPGPTTSTCASPSGSASGKPAAKPPKPSSITVDVYNATDKQGLAGRTSDQLEQRGFQIGDVDNDPENKTIAVSAEVRYGPKGKANAKVVAAQFSEPKLVNDKRADKTVSVALGNGFTSLVSPEQAAAALSPSPAATC